MALTDKLSAIADAIRTKTGNTEEMTLEQMAMEIAGIKGDPSVEDSIVTRSLTEYSNNRIEVVGQCAFQSAKIKSVYLPKVKTVQEGGFYKCYDLVNVELPELVELGLNAFAYNTALKEISLPKVTHTVLQGYGAFRSCTNLQYVDLPSLGLGFEAGNTQNLGLIETDTFRDCKNLKTLNLPNAWAVGAQALLGCSSLTELSLPRCALVYTETFMNCTALEKVDFGTKVDFIRQNTFKNCPALCTLILRGSEVSTLSYSSIFTDSPFAIGGNGGTIYVPANLVDSYKVATNWSALYEAGTCNFVPIEGSEYEE